MIVVTAEVFGLCFGVRDALAVTREVARPQDVVVLGELVHNPQVRDELAARGFGQLSETDRDAAPAAAAVMITAHGISRRRRDELLSAGKTLIDTTCPLVRRVHEAADRLERDGCRVIVIGRRGHVEVQGIVEDLHDPIIVEQVRDVTTWPEARLGIVCQSTCAPEDAESLRRAIVERNPQASVRMIDTICQPTKDRRSAVDRLTAQVDAVVVVGGANSNNTRQLVELARRGGRPTFHIERAADLQSSWFIGVRRVGLTAGTSTLDETIDEVRRALESIETGDAASPTTCNANRT